MHHSVTVLSSCQISVGVFSNQDRTEKWSVLQQNVLFGVLNDEFVALFLDSVLAHLPQSHSFQCMHGYSAVVMMQLVRILNTNIYQGSV